MLRDIDMPKQFPSYFLPAIKRYQALVAAHSPVFMQMDAAAIAKARGYESSGTGKIRLMAPLLPK
jgi:hypothetical protein